MLNKKSKKTKKIIIKAFHKNKSRNTLKLKFIYILFYLFKLIEFFACFIVIYI